MDRVIVSYLHTSSTIASLARKQKQLSSSSSVEYVRQAYVVRGARREESGRRDGLDGYAAAGEGHVERPKALQVRTAELKPLRLEELVICPLLWSGNGISEWRT